MQRLLLVAAWISSIPSFVLPSCSYPPEFWCSSPEIATECDVTKQCASWMRDPTSSRGSSLVKRSNDENLVVFADTDDKKDKKRLRITVLYEALCPDCQWFIINQLAPTIAEFGTEFWSHVRLTLLPYGNAEEHYDPKTDRWIFRCQHGPDECLGNLIATCAMNSCGNDPVRWFPFVHCMELSSRKLKGADGRDSRKDGEKCANEAKLNWTAISECSSDWRGNLVQHAVAKATPHHEYVPWIIVNGQHTEEMQQDAEKDFFRFVCRFLRHPKPFACYKQTASSRCYAASPFKNT